MKAMFAEMQRLEISDKALMLKHTVAGPQLKGDNALITEAHNKSSYS